MSVPWWAWLLAAAVGVLIGFTVAGRRAPMDTDLWDGGEPGIRVQPRRPEGDL